MGELVHMMLSMVDRNVRGWRAVGVHPPENSCSYNGWSTGPVTTSTTPPEKGQEKTGEKRKKRVGQTRMPVRFRLIYFATRG